MFTPTAGPACMAAWPNSPRRRLTRPGSRLHADAAAEEAPAGQAAAGEAAAGQAAAGEERLVVVLSLADSETSAEIPGAGDVLAGRAAVAAAPAGKPVTVTLPAHDWVILSAG